MRELLLVGIQQGYPKERQMKKSSVQNGYRNLATGIKVYQIQKFSAL